MSLILPYSKTSIHQYWVVAKLLINIHYCTIFHLTLSKNRLWLKSDICLKDSFELSHTRKY